MSISENVRRRPFLLIGALALIVAGHSGEAGAGQPAEVTVQSRDDYFLPSSVTVERGGTVVWDFTTGERSHTATDSSGMGLFDSGIVEPGGPSFSFRFRAAGSYPYTCTLHTADMNGHVDVPMRVWPERGRVGHAFRVRWAAGEASEGFVYDVQAKLRGGAWTSWMSGATVGHAMFTPDAAGTLRFRARLRGTGGGASEWSEPVTIEIAGLSPAA
jgi:plastocyanin